MFPHRLGWLRSGCTAPSWRWSVPGKRTAHGGSQHPAAGACSGAAPLAAHAFSRVARGADDRRAARANVGSARQISASEVGFCEVGAKECDASQVRSGEVGALQRALGVKPVRDAEGIHSHWLAAGSGLSRWQNSRPRKGISSNTCYAIRRVHGHKQGRCERLRCSVLFQSCSELLWVYETRGGEME